MELSIEPLIYVAIFVSVYLLIGGVYLLVFGRSIRLNARVNRRLSLLEKGRDRDEVMEQLRKEMTLHEGTRALPLIGGLADKAQKGNVAFTPAMLIGLMAVLAVVAFVALSMLTSANTAVAGLISAVFGIGAVHLWVGRAAKQRLALMEEQLPEAIELIVRSLRVGHPLGASIGIVAKEVSDPLGSEMGFIADEAAYGRDIADALRSLGDRSGLQDLRFLAVAVGIQQKSGGNLAEILDGLAKVVRSRFKLFRKVKAITAEARWSGTFLSAFPVLALIGINVMEPTYYAEVEETVYFVPAAVVVFGFLVINVLFMRKMVNIKV